MHRLLIVEDEDRLRHWMADGMDWAGLGYEVAGAASNGIGGVEILKARRLMWF